MIQLRTCIRCGHRLEYRKPELGRSILITDVFAHVQNPNIFAKCQECGHHELLSKWLLQILEYFVEMRQKLGYAGSSVPIGLGFVTPQLYAMARRDMVKITDEALAQWIRERWEHSESLSCNPSPQNTVCVVLCLQ